MWSASSMHGDLDGVEADQALLHQVLEPTRAGDDDVDAATAVRPPGGFCATPPKIVVTSSGRRPRRAARASRSIWVASSRVGASTRPDGSDAAAACCAGEARDHRNREGEGLAAAGLAAAEHVSAGERVGQGLRSESGTVR